MKSCLLINTLRIMKTLIFSLLAFVVLSCSKNEDKNNYVNNTITPVLIGKGTHSGTATESNLVITNQIQWEQTMNLLTYQNTSTFTETNIDFNHFQLLASIDTIRGDTGYSINISNVTENENNITVTVTSEYSGSGFFVLSRPFQIVKIPRSNKPVVFQ